MRAKNGEFTTPIQQQPVMNMQPRPDGMRVSSQNPKNPAVQRKN
jgi:hypothetical protein